MRQLPVAPRGGVCYNALMKCKIAALMAICLALTGCRGVMDKYAPERTDYRAAASCYPMYALSLIAIQGAPGLTLSMLTQPQDGCLRSYQLSEWDALQAAGYDAVILGGRGLESYEETLLSWTGGPIIVSAMRGLDLIGGGAAGEDVSHFDTENPWLFLSPDGGLAIVRSVAANMAQIDPDYADLYAENAAEAEARFEQLAVDMLACLMDTPSRRVAVLHEGLPYLADFLGLTVACTYERESGEDVEGAMLADMLDQLSASGAEVALLEKQAPAALIRNLEAAGYAVCLLDTLSAHAADGDPDAYYEYMLSNARALEAAFTGHTAD